jgi:CRISPR-associated protein Cas2
MLTLVIYDISDNNERNQQIKTLQHYGLHRIQKSAFLGNLDQKKRSQLENNMQIHFSGPKDSIYIIPICDKCKDLTRIFSEEERVLEDRDQFKII